MAIDRDSVCAISRGVCVVVVGFTLAQPIGFRPVAWRCAADGVVDLCSVRLGSGFVVQVTC